MSELSKSLTAGILAVMITAGAVFLAFTGYKWKKKEANPYDYDLSDYKGTGQAEITHNETLSFNVEAEKLYAVAVGPGDRIYVAVPGGVQFFDKTGTKAGEFKTEGQLTCMAFDAEGRLLGGAGDHVETYDTEGRISGIWEPLGGRALLTSVAIDKDSVYIADQGQRMVWIFDHKGVQKGMIGAKDPDSGFHGFILPSPYFDVAVGPKGYLWVANGGTHRVQKFSGEGKLLSSWGKASMEIDGFVGCCNPSHFAVDYDGSFITAEKGIPRVKLYNAEGKLESVIAGPAEFDENTVGLDLAIDSNGRIVLIDPKRKQVRVFVKKSEGMGERENG